MAPEIPTNFSSLGFRWFPGNLCFGLRLNGIHRDRVASLEQYSFFRMVIRLVLSSSPRGLRREPTLNPLLAIGFAIVAIGATTLAAKINPMLAVAALMATSVGFSVLRAPHYATAVVVFLLFSNAAVVAVRFHGVPGAIGGAYPLLLAVPILERILVRREGIRVDAVFLWMVAFLAVQILSAAFSRDPSAAFSEVQKFLLEGVVLYFLVFNAVRTESELRTATWAIVLGGAVVAFFPVLQQLTGTFQHNFGGFGQSAAEESFSTSSGSTQLRLSGAIGEKNRFSQNMLMVAPMGFWLALGSLRRRSRWLGLGLAGLSLVAFALAFSRGNAIAAVLTVGILACLRVITPRHLLWIGLAGVLVMAAVPQYWTRITSIVGITGLVGSQPKSSAEAPDGSFRRRAEVMFAAGLVYLDHPVIGVGPGLSKTYSREYGNQLGLRRVETDRQAHSLHLGLAAETGTLGLACLFGIFGTLLVRLENHRRRWMTRRPAYAYLATGYLAALLLYQTTGLFLHMSYIRFIFLIVALAGATVAVGARLANDQERAPHEGGV